MRRALLFLSFALFLSACKKEPTDEELTDAVFGVWEPYMISTLKEMKNYDSDSSFFYENGIRDRVSFLSEGKMLENNRRLSYFIQEGNLNIITDLDTTLFDILFIDSEKMILEAEGAKVYYEKFKY